MRVSWEKLVYHAGTLFGNDVSNELQNKKEVNIPDPEYSQEILDRHKAREALHAAQTQKLQAARRQQKATLEGIVADEDKLDTYPDAPVKLAELDNIIEKAELEATEPLPIKLTETEKMQMVNESKSIKERQTRYQRERGQAFALIRGQCTQVLLDQMKHDPDWDSVNQSYEPLLLIHLIEKTILAQTEDQYPFACVYENEVATYGFLQQDLSNEHYYEKFNTKIGVGESCGVARRHPSLAKYVLHETDPGKELEDLTPEQLKEVNEDAEERYNTYIFLKQAGKQHNKLRMDMKDDYTKGKDNYPKNRQDALRQLNRYTKSSVPQTPSSEGTMFAQSQQQTPKNGKGDKHFDKVYWKNKECYNCHKKGHPSWACKQAKKEEDDAASAASVKKLEKSQKQLKKSFAQLQAQMQELVEDEESALSDSEDEEERSHFQVGFDSEGVQFTQLDSGLDDPAGVVLEEADKTGIALPQFGKDIEEVLCKQNTKKLDLDLRKIILLDNQSTTDLFCNSDYVTDILKTPHDYG